MPTFSVTHPWEKRSNETPIAYERFQAYLEWPGKLSTFAEKIAAQLNIAPTSITQTAYRHQWRERKDAYIAARVGTQVEPTEEEQQKLRNRARNRVRYHAYLSEKFLNAAEHLVDTYLEQTVLDEEGNPTGDTRLVRGVLREASEALAKGIEMERLSYGLPGTITRIEHDLRQQVEVSLDIYNQVLAIVSFHVCDDCRASLGTQIAELQDRVSVAQRDVEALHIGDGD